MPLVAERACLGTEILERPVEQLHQSELIERVATWA
jgi:hypothetical protein